ncbi:Uncharacterized protein FWK35_00038116, partial [Aphis craccivora]
NNRDARLETDRQLHARYGRITHLDLNLSAFHYAVNYNYSIHQSVVIGKMDKLCMYCTQHSSFRMRHQVSMGCADGKVKLPELHKVN